MQEQDVRVAVLLNNPKFSHNVGGALRACSVFSAGELIWTGERVLSPEKWPVGSRLPREERLREYQRVRLRWDPDPNQIIDNYVCKGFTPVAVELRENAENLIDFIHPEKALYIFGPEDASLSRGILTACHRFVRIPSRSCLNLAAAVNVVLYDRIAKTEKYISNI